MSRGVYIFGGSGNTVTPDVSGLVAINCTGEVFTSSDSDKAIFHNRTVIIDENGAAIQMSHETITQDTLVIMGNKAQYFIDATTGNRNITVHHTANYPVLFIRVDNSANAVTIIAGTGSINGVASVTMPTQFQQRNVTSDGNNFYG